MTAITTNIRKADSLSSGLRDLIFVSGSLAAFGTSVHLILRAPEDILMPSYVSMGLWVLAVFLGLQVMSSQHSAIASMYKIAALLLGVLTAIIAAPMGLLWILCVAMGLGNDELTLKTFLTWPVFCGAPLLFVLGLGRD